MNTTNIKKVEYNEIQSTFLEMDKNSSSEYGSDVRYFKCRIIPYSTRQEITKIRQQISHSAIEETVFALEVGELVRTDMKMFTKANIVVTRITILPGFSGRMVKLIWKNVQCNLRFGR